MQLENESGGILSEESVGSNSIYIVNLIVKTHDKPYNMEATDHLVLEEVAGQGSIGDKIVQQNATGTGDITDIRMIASGGGYTSLPTATIDGQD